MKRPRSGSLVQPGAALDDSQLRVVFLQRRARLSDGAGIEFYDMDAFGLPLLEVVSKSASGAQLYETIGRRVASLLRAPIPSQAGSGAKGGKGGRRTTWGASAGGGDYSSDGSQRSTTDETTTTHSGDVGVGARARAS